MLTARLRRKMFPLLKVASNAFAFACEQSLSSTTLKLLGHPFSFPIKKPSPLNWQLFSATRLRWLP